MTCILGIETSGRVVMGGDSAALSGLDLVVRADPKVFRNGPFLMGFTTSFRMGQLLRYRFEPPAHPAGMEDERFMATVFVDAVRDCLKDGGFAKKNDDQEEGGNFLVGYRGRLYEVGPDYQIGLSADGIAAVGCGYTYALAAARALSRVSHMGAEAIVRHALEVAEAFSAGVRGPFVVLTLDAESAAA